MADYVEVDGVRMVVQGAQVLAIDWGTVAQGQVDLLPPIQFPAGKRLHTTPGECVTLPNGLVVTAPSFTVTED